MRRDELTGYALVTISAVAFSAKGIIAKLIYAHGVDPVTLLALRFSMALPLFWAAVFFFPSEKVGPRDALWLAASGVLGLYAAALADFYGLLYIDASLERVILFTYPAMVVVLASLFFKERVTRKKALSIALTYAGCVLTLNVFRGVERAEALGAALILFSAAVYAGSYILTEVLSKRVSGVKMAAYGTTAATAAFLATWRGETFPAAPEAWWLIALLAVASTFVPVLTITIGIRRIGASRAALASSIGPVSTAVLAYMILGESMGLVELAGMALVIAGVLVISSERRNGV